MLKLFEDKKADFSYNWVEFTFILLTIMGFIFAISIKSKLILYIVSYLLGLQTGIFSFTKYIQKKGFTFWAIMIGLLIGFLIGSFGSNKLVIIILFILGCVNGYMLMKKDIFGSTKK